MVLGVIEIGILKKCPQIDLLMLSPKPSPFGAGDLIRFGMAEERNKGFRAVHRDE